MSLSLQNYQQLIKTRKLQCKRDGYCGRLIGNANVISFDVPISDNLE